MDNPSPANLGAPPPRPSCSRPLLARSYGRGVTPEGGLSVFPKKGSGRKSQKEALHELDVGGSRPKREPRSGAQCCCGSFAKPGDVQSFRTPSYSEFVRAHGRRWRVARLRHRLSQGSRRVLGIPPRIRSTDLSHRKRSAARAQAGDLQRDFGERADPAPRPRTRTRPAGDRPQAGGGVAGTSATVPSWGAYS